MIAEFHAVAGATPEALIAELCTHDLLRWAWLRARRAARSAFY